MNTRCLAAVAALCFLMASLARAGQAGETITVSGKISARGATLTTPKGEVYKIEQDERGKSLAKVMNGESAEVVGTVSGAGNARQLKVLGYADERVAAGHEYWRRMRCMACVVLPATRNAAVPADLRGASPIAGRHFSLARKFAAWARDARFLWVAADNEILQIDLAQAKVARSFGRADGLPDQLVYELASDGTTLWIVHRGGVAALVIGGERVADIPRLKSRFARVALDADGAVVIADTGTFRYKTPAGEPVVYPAIPTAARIGKLVENGIWVAHWARKTGHLLTSPASVGERLYVGSYGDLYELADGTWTRIAENGWGQAASKGRLWFADAKGLEEFDPAAKKTATWTPPESIRGNYIRLLVTEAAAWLVAEPRSAGREGPPTGGGLARFDLATHKWDAWPRINGFAANSVACLAWAEENVKVKVKVKGEEERKGQDGSLPPSLSPSPSLRASGAMWAATMEGQYSTKSAHPGMTTTTRLDFKATGFALHRYGDQAGKWESFPLKLAELESRLICGQDGKRNMDAITPQTIEELSVGGTRIFALARLVPKKYFGGYWPCVEQVASRPAKGDTWAAAFGHHPEQMGLQGEQPLVLNISSGELTRIGSNLKDLLWEAVGHDLVLALFPHGGRHWMVAESSVAFFDEAAGAWHRLVEPHYRWYWRATAALDDGRWLYLGSDRGLVCRLDLATSRFESVGALKDRSIARITRGKKGEMFVVGGQAPLGLLPVQLRDTLKPLDCDVARFDGKAWSAAKPEDLPPADAGPPWSLKLFDRKDHLDKSQGNTLCDPASKPRYYVKEVFYPLFLCASPDGARLWLSTYTGLLRLDVRATATK